MNHFSILHPSKNVSMPCVVHKRSSILLSNGKRKKAEELVSSDCIIDAMGIPRNIHIPDKLDHITNSKCITLHKGNHASPVILPYNTQVCTLNKNWIMSVDIQPGDIVANVTPRYNLPKVLPIPSHFRHMTYEIGFVVGACLTSAVAGDERDETDFYLDTNSHVYRSYLINALYVLGLMSLIQKQEKTYCRRSDFHYDKLSVKSSLLSNIVAQLVQNKRMIPDPYVSIDAQFIKGLYESIVTGNQHFFSDQLFDFVLFLRSLIPDKLEENTIDRADLDTHDQSVVSIYAYTPFKNTSVICDSIPIRSTTPYTKTLIAARLTN